MLIFEEILGLTFTRIVSHTTDATKSLIFGVKNLHLILVYSTLNLAGMTAQESALLCSEM